MFASPGRVLALVLVTGFALRIIPIWFGLPYPMARPDEETALGHAAGVMRGDLNPQFFHWPSLTFYFFGGVFAALTWVRSWWDAGEPGYTALVLLGRGIIASVGTLTLYVLYQLVRRFADRELAVMAAAVLAVAMLHVRESHFAMTDVLMTVWLLLSLLLLLRIAMQPSGPGGLPRRASRWCAVAGLVAGLATSTKYNAAAVAARYSAPEST